MWSNPGFVSNFIRWFFSILDNIGYFFLSGIFNIFFTIANANFFQGDVINEFYERVQLILGIFMIFILSFTLLQIIINPDMFKDKQKGAGSLAMRVAVMLVLLTLIVPIKVPEDGNPLNEKINNNGILFGFLYQIQDTVVKDNVLGKLILGYNVADVGDSVTYEDIDGNLRLQGMENVGDVITAEIAKAFITPALKDGYTEVNADPESDNYYEKSALCPTDIAPYLNRLVSSSGLLDHVNLTCKPEGGKEIYAFSYTGFGGVVCAIVMTIIIIGFTLDIAVRAIKLAILRLIAPIPIISYISPGQEKNGAFGNWVKTLTSTYLSLFIRLIIIYFGIYLIILLRNGDLVAGIKEATLANVFVIIGILVFMKEAPKFFQDMLGIKGDGKLFSGIGTMLGAAALTGGLAGSVVTGARAAWEENKMAKRPAWMGIGGAITSGLTSGLGGAWVGTKALATSDKKVASSVMSAMNKRNAVRASHSTLPGRIASGAFGMFTGSTLAERDQRILDLNKEAASQAKTLKGLEEEEAAKNVAYVGYDLTDASGHTSHVNVDYNSLMSAMEGTDANGNFTYQGVKYSRDNFGKHVTDDILKKTTQAYVDGTAVLRTNAESFAANGKIRSQKRTTDHAFSQAGGKAAETYGNGDYSRLGPSIGAATEATTDMSTNIKNIKHRANHNANQNKS